MHKIDELSLRKDLEKETKKELIDKVIMLTDALLKVKEGLEKLSKK